MNLLSLEFELPLISFLFILLLCIAYVPKKKVNLIENKAYEAILICSLVASFTDTVIHLISATHTLETLNTNYYNIISFMNRIISTIFVIVFSCLLLYTVFITYKKIHNKPQAMVTSIILFDLLFFIVTGFTKIEILEIGTVRNVTGSMIIIGYGVVAVLLAITIFIILSHFKKDKRYYAIFLILLMLLFLYICSLLFKGLIIYDVILVLLCYIMYFSIENPDVQMLVEVSLAKEQAEKANNAKTDFLSSMSHEIRTPLNAIVGFSQALIEEEIPDTAKDEVEDIITASMNLLDIVNGILDISKIEANKLEIVNTEYNLNKVLDELVLLTKARIGEKPIEFRTNFDASIPPVLYGDYIRLKQIVLNLLTNAAKYTKEGFIDFEVHSVIKGDICRLIISVKDTGIGIKEKNLDKLFTKFERFDKEQNITIEGTGLGLAITKKLVDLMHGKIVVQSVYGEGSKFTVAVDQQVVAKEHIAETTTTTDNITISGKHILVVDDNTINLKVATRLLRNYDVVVDTCESGQECLDKIKSGNTYDLILMDDMMPKMSGVETLHNLKQIPNFNTTTVALTANAISGMREKYLQDGFDDYLAKPIDKLELNRVLEHFLTQTTDNCDIMKIGCDTMKDVNYLKNNGVDVDKSLELFGDMETYNETMVDFFSAVVEKLEKIKKFKETSDMANYAIEVHSLKSDSKYLGFTKLAELSYQHEMASKEMNTEFVYENYDALMEEAGRIVNVVSTYLGKQNTIVVEKKAPISDKKILVVDDSNIVRNLIQRMFDDELQVVSANDGVEATQIIASTPMDTIYGLLLDLNMPKADGFAVLDWFKKYNLFAKIPVAIITGEDSKENIERANTYPIVGVLSKPFNERDVKNIVNDMRNFK